MPFAQGGCPARYDACLHHANDDPRTPLLRANIAGLEARIEAARGRGGHAADAVQLLVVTKSQPASIFAPLAAAGVTDIGENRIQSASERRPLAPGGLRWHGIGSLQRNKARTALATFDVFHALDGLRLAERLESLLAEGASSRVWPVYLQVNTADDPDKGGVAPDEALSTLERLAACPHLQVLGFMTMGRRAATDADLRATFCTLREIRDEAVRRGRGSVPPSGLSMGMSDDFELAVEEGATVVRVGRAVFRDVGKQATSLTSTPDPHGDNVAERDGEQT